MYIVLSHTLRHVPWLSSSPYPVLRRYLRYTLAQTKSTAHRHKHPQMHSPLPSNSFSIARNMRPYSASRHGSAPEPAPTCSTYIARGVDRAPLVKVACKEL